MNVYQLSIELKLLYLKSHGPQSKYGPPLKSKSFNRSKNIPSCQETMSLYCYDMRGVIKFIINGNICQRGGGGEKAIKIIHVFPTIIGHK